MNYRSSMDTPIGMLRLCADEKGLCEVSRIPDLQMVDEKTCTLLEEAKAQLGQYFAGERTAFDLTLSVQGTEFERSVWQRMLAIPFGQTRTYGQIAKEIDKENASRAVGAACGRNPLLIVMPCHRVVGASGKLSGFAAGLQAKRWLLAHEGHVVEPDRIKA